MKRSGPPQRRTPLRRSLAPMPNYARPIRNKGLRARSKATGKATEAARFIRRQMIIDADGKCMIRVRMRARLLDIDMVDRPVVIAAMERCRRYAEGVHELRKRSAGGSLTNPANCVPACNVCNGWVEDEPRIAHALGLVVRSGDRTFDELGENQ